MPQHRYSRWDNSQEPFGIAADDIFGAIADDLLDHGDLRGAIRDLLRRGISARDGRRIVGAEELRQRVREQRRALLQRHNLEHIFDQLNEELERILEMERDTLTQQQADAASVLGRRAVNGLRRNVTRDEPRPEGAIERMWYDAAQCERKLNVLPETFHGRLTELRSYTFANQEAQEAFDDLVATLQRRMLGHYLKDVREQLEGMSPTDQALLRQMLHDLTELLRLHFAGEPIDKAYGAFKEKYPQMFAGNPDMPFEDFLAMLAQQAAELQGLMSSLSPEDLAELQGLLDWSFLDDGLRDAMREFTELIMQLAPGDAAAYDFAGQHPLSLDEAMHTIDRLHALDQFESRLDRAMWRGFFDELETELAEDALGPEGGRMLRELQDLAKRLEEARYLKRTPGGWRLTTRAVRRLGTHALQEIFSQIEKTIVGRHQGRTGRDAGTPSGETRPYAYGLPMNVDVPRTVFNALLRSGGAVPLDLRFDDFEIQELEFQARCATVLLVDQSSSMERLGRFAAAKRVAFALLELIRQRFPRDELYVVGFHTLAQQVAVTQLPHLREKPRQGVVWVNESIPLAYAREQPDAIPMDFTNVQEGLRISRQLLARAQARTKQIIMITDGQPTAYITGQHLVLSYPEVEDPCAAALKEARRCTRQHIRINTFMLRQDYYLEAFVQRLTEINRGRAFFTTPHTLGSAVMRDYVRGRTSRV